MRAKTKDLENWKRKLRKSMVYECCEDIRCRRPMMKVSDMQVNHHVRVNHRRDIAMERDNVSVCCQAHGSPEDYNECGAHTTNSERIFLLEIRYGEPAASRAVERMEEAGFIC